MNGRPNWIAEKKPWIRTLLLARVITNYGQYAGIENSVYFEKKINH